MLHKGLHPINELFYTFSHLSCHFILSSMYFRHSILLIYPYSLGMLFVVFFCFESVYKYTHIPVADLLPALSCNALYCVLFLADFKS